MKSTRWIHFLLFAYILSLGFTDLLKLPLTGRKIQLPEIIFMLVLFTTLLSWNQVKNRFHFHKPDMALLLLVAISFFSSAFHFTKSSLLDSVELLYLFCSYFILKSLIACLPDPVAFFKQSFIFSGALTASISIIGWTMFQLGGPGRLVSSPDCYFLYTTSLVQSTAWMTTPNMVLDFLAISMLIAFFMLTKVNIKNFKHYGLLAILFLGIMVTFSKSIFFLVIAGIYFFNKTSSSPRWIKTSLHFISMVLFLITMISSHFLITKNEKHIERIHQDQSCYIKNACGSIAGDSIYETNYWINKTTAIHAGLRSPLTGIGPGNYNHYVDEQKRIGNYPAYFVSFDPHCTYTGIFAEMGFPGLLVIFLICYLLWKNLNPLWIPETNWRYTLLACMLFFSMEALVLDILHFRHLWLLLAMISITLQQGTLALFPAKQSHDVQSVGKNEQS